MALGREEIAASGVELAAEGGVDLVAPDDGFAVGVVEVVELAPNEEVVLHEVEQALDHGGAVGVALLVGAELEAARFTEGCHLGHGNHVFAGAAQHDDAAVVDHADGAGAAHVVEGVIEEDLALEPRELRVQLDVGQPRVSEREPRDLHGPLAPADVSEVGDVSCRISLPG
ncbi:MAG: hypothetical protein IPI67_24535 [Myxococcales bacterium]|nr:hypothetical protein [Myxococcales bacterium]